MIEQAWTAYEFLNRFTAVERAVIRNAGQTDSTVADWLQLAASAQEIINTDSATIQGMDYLVSAGLLTQERADAIMGA
jgi:hypothetical protein